jgi:general nucleoside transport system permease protein
MIDLLGTVADALVHAIPLLLTGLAVAIAFRAGVWNIGADGQLLAGATAGTALGLMGSMLPGGVGLILMLLSGALFGALWAAIAHVFRQRFGVSEVISTIMLNFVALNGVSYLVRGPMQEPSHIYPQTAALPDMLRLPIVWSQTRVHLGVLIAVTAAVAVWTILKHTAAGFRLRATGASPTVAVSAGRVNTSRVGMFAMWWSGALAGVWGDVLSLRESLARVRIYGDRRCPAWSVTPVGNCYHGAVLRSARVGRQSLPT